MALPKRKVSHARQGDHRAHHALRVPHLVECEHCHAQRRAHHACPTCGWYAGRQAIEIKKKKGAEAGS